MTTEIINFNRLLLLLNIIPNIDKKLSFLKKSKKDIKTIYNPSFKFISIFGISIFYATFCRFYVIVTRNTRFNYTTSPCKSYPGEGKGFSDGEKGRRTPRKKRKFPSLKFRSAAPSYQKKLAFNTLNYASALSLSIKTSR